MSKKFLFKRESGDFDDILTDKSMRKHIGLKITWPEHLLIEVHDEKDTGIYGYIILKYGDSLTDFTHKDRTPIPGKDYKPIRY